MFLTQLPCCAFSLGLRAMCTRSDGPHTYTHKKNMCSPDDPLTRACTHARAHTHTHTPCGQFRCTCTHTICPAQTTHVHARTHTHTRDVQLRWPTQPAHQIEWMVHTLSHRSGWLRQPPHPPTPGLYVQGRDVQWPLTAHRPAHRILCWHSGKPQVPHYLCLILCAARKAQTAWTAPNLNSETLCPAPCSEQAMPARHALLSIVYSTSVTHSPQVVINVHQVLSLMCVMASGPGTCFQPYSLL